MIGNLLAWLVIGALAGWLASMVMRTNASQGLLMDIIVGIIGAFIGGFVLNLLGLGAAAGDFSVLSLVTAFIGAVILLGMNEGQFPRVVREGSILSDGERRALRERRLDLDPDTSRRLFDENLLAHVGLTRASHALVLTRALADDESRPQAPSPYWIRLRELFPKLQPHTIARRSDCDIDCIGTPRQLVTRLMRWVRSQPEHAAILHAGAERSPRSAAPDRLTRGQQNPRRRSRTRSAPAWSVRHLLKVILLDLPIQGSLPDSQDPCRLLAISVRQLQRVADRFLLELLQADPHDVFQPPDRGRAAGADRLRQALRSDFRTR